MNRALASVDAHGESDGCGGLATVSVKGIWRALMGEPASFWWLCIYIFFEYVRPQSIYPMLDVLPWAKLSLLLALGLWLIQLRDHWRPSRLTLPVALFFLIAVLSSIMAQYPARAFDALNVQVNWLLLFIAFIGIVNTQRRFFIVLLLFLLVSFKMAQHGAITWASRGFSFERWGVAGTPGWFGNAADLGVQMLIFTPLAAGFVLALQSNWGWLKRLFFWSFPVAGLVTIVATGQRGTLLGLATMAGFAVLFFRSRIRGFIAIAAIGTVVFLAMPEEYRARFESMTEDRTAVSRLTYWKRGLDMVSEYPVLGVGYNNFVPYYESHFPGESLREHIQEVAHSGPITVLSELGWTGAVAYVWIAFRILLVNRASIRSARAAGNTVYEYCAFGLNLGLIGFLAGSVFVSVAYYPFLWMQACFSGALHRVIVDWCESAHCDGAR